MDIGVRTWKAPNARQRHLDELMRGVRAAEGLSGGVCGGGMIHLTDTLAGHQQASQGEGEIGGPWDRN